MRLLCSCMHTLSKTSVQTMHAETLLHRKCSQPSSMTPLVMRHLPPDRCQPTALLHACSAPTWIELRRLKAQVGTHC